MTDRYSGPFETANVAGMVLAGVLIVVIGLIAFTASADRLRWGWRYAIWTVLGLSAAPVAMLLLATGCRAALLGLACCIPLVCRLPTARQLADRKTAILLALAVVVALMLGGMFLTEPTSGLRRWLDLDLASASVTHRFLVWQAALASIVQHPFVGLGRVGYAQASDLWCLPAGVRDLYDGALCVPLTLWAETGLAILLPLVWFSVASFLVGLSLRRATVAASRIAALTGCALLLTTWICGLFQVHHRLGWWWLLLAGALALIWSAQMWAQGWNLLAGSRRHGLARTSAWASALTFGILGAVYSAGCFVPRRGYAELQSGANPPVVWMHPPTSAKGQRILLGIDDGVDPHRCVDAIGKPLLQAGFTIGLRMGSASTSEAFARSDLVLAIAWGHTGGEWLRQSARSGHPRVLAVDPQWDDTEAIVADASSPPAEPSGILTARFAPFQDTASLKTWCARHGVQITSVPATLTPPEQVLVHLSAMGFPTAP